MFDPEITGDLRAVSCVDGDRNVGQREGVNGLVTDSQNSYSCAWSSRITQVTGVGVLRHNGSNTFLKSELEGLLR
ncbi:hypothetical protein ACIRG5_30150 [Lentzea sp. NPDC102401]|uniref:hypothetical protein n=1 Tax=Lentzea sp. NPDC102401 TaxID=3364128 RepID=UPI00382FE297